MKVYSKIHLEALYYTTILIHFWVSTRSARCSLDNPGMIRQATTFLTLIEQVELVENQAVFQNSPKSTAKLEE